MTIRTPNPYASRQTLVDLNRIKERLSLNEERLSSGNAIARLGDDPTGSALIVDFKSSVNKNEAYLQQAQSAGVYLQGSETAVTSMESILTRLQEIGQQGLTGTLGANDRADLATEVSSLRDDLMNLANTQVQGKYLFSGTMTTTMPFAYNTASPATPPVLYSGNSNTVDLDVAMSTSVTTNVPGDTLCFGPGGAGSSTDVFQAVTDLMDGLNSNNLTQVKTACDNLSGVHDRINSTLTDLGGRQAGLTELQNNLTAYNLSLTSIQGTYENLDYAKAITQYSADQTAQSATLSVLAKRDKQNLFDFLG
nr:flagellar hook-associated protein FlgL [uncultured Holophaga sp.]